MEFKPKTYYDAIKASTPEQLAEILIDGVTYGAKHAFNNLDFNFSDEDLEYLRNLYVDFLNTPIVFRDGDGFYLVGGDS